MNLLSRHFISSFTILSFSLTAMAGALTSEFGKSADVTLLKRVFQPEGMKVIEDLKSIARTGSMNGSRLAAKTVDDKSVVVVSGNKIHFAGLDEHETITQGSMQLTPGLGHDKGILTNTLAFYLDRSDRELGVEVFRDYSHSGKAHYASLHEYYGVTPVKGEPGKFLTTVKTTSLETPEGRVTLIAEEHGSIGIQIENHSPDWFAQSEYHLPAGHGPVVRLEYQPDGQVIVGTLQNGVESSYAFQLSASPRKGLPPRKPSEITLLNQTRVANRAEHLEVNIYRPKMTRAQAAAITSERLDAIGTP